VAVDRIGVNCACTCRCFSETTDVSASDCLAVAPPEKWKVNLSGPSLGESSLKFGHDTHGAQVSSRAIVVADVPCVVLVGLGALDVEHHLVGILKLGNGISLKTGHDVDPIENARKLPWLSVDSHTLSSSQEEEPRDDRCGVHHELVVGGIAVPPGHPVHHLDRRW
jgi:hypothetical protein